MIKVNLEKIKNIAGEKVTLVAVTKNRDVNQLLELYRCGHLIFGENRVQELLSKKSLLPSDIEWHLIGHLQTNKVKSVLPHVSLIHSVDSLKLLKEINKEAAKLNKKINVLLQVFIASEETKFGLSEDELNEIVNSNFSSIFPSINLCGLMGMASNTEDKEKVKNEFKFLNGLFNNIKAKNTFPHFKILSMGMSNDFQDAVQCGSNMIRVGSALFE